MPCERAGRVARWLWVTVLFAAAGAADPRPPGWAVATAHPLATQAAVEVAGRGGNAFDAAVAATAALAVVEPMGSGLGGGGFWLIHRAADGHEVMVDGRERAPLGADRDMYLDGQGEPVPGASLDGPLAAAIPGEPAAIAHIARAYGRLPLRQSLAPAIALAEAGFVPGERFRQRAAWRRTAFNARARELFLSENGEPLRDRPLRQPELAETLREIADRGHDGFYTGWVASTLVSEIRAAGGIWTQADLSAYALVERSPIVTRYGGARIVSASLPSSGGIVLAQILNLLELKAAPALDAAGRTHAIVEAMRRAYRDRALYLGDADFVAVDQARLISREHAAGLAGDISENATPSGQLPASAVLGAGAGGEDTTHLSIIDDEGNRVGATLSINYPFGSGFVSRGTGVTLNNEMDDFVIKPGVANAYGLVGGDANAIEPGKRPLSSMSPTFVDNAELVSVIGTPGGSRIITMVLLAVLELLDNGERGVDRVVALPRYHHQYLPDVITYEPGALDEKRVHALRARGHALEERTSPYGDMQAVLWDRRAGTISAASDPRGEGEARTW